jgi:hypothetical protein
MIWNTPRRPQENGVIERSQGTADRWCEPWTCGSPEELQGRLERMDRLYREVYPYRGGRSRAATDPGLSHSGRAYVGGGVLGLGAGHGPPVGPIRGPAGGPSRFRVDL